MSFRGIRIGLHNLKVWLPVIWKDRQWDHFFFFTILRHKIGMMEDFFRDIAIHVGAEKDADNMKICVVLLDRLVEDEYMERAEKYLPGMGLLSHTPSEYRTEIRRQLWVERSRMLLHQDLEYLGKMLSKHSFGWWD